MLSFVLFVLTNVSLTFICIRLVSNFHETSLLRKIPLFLSLFILVDSFLVLTIGALPWHLLQGSILTSVSVVLGILSLQKNEPIIPPLNLNLQSRYLIICTAAFLALIIDSFLQNLFFASVYSIDDIVYHASNPAYWLMSEKIITTPLTYQSYFPFNSVLLGLSFMLEMHSDALSGMSPFLYVLLFSSSSLALLRHLSIDWKYAFSCPIIILSSLPIHHNLSFFVSDEFFGATIILTAIVLQTRASPLHYFYTGCLLGFVAGMKTLYFPYVLIIFCLNLKTLKHALLMTLGIFLTGSYWYIKNALETNNPFYPAENLFGKGPLSQLDMYHTTVIGTWQTEGSKESLIWLIKDSLVHLPLTTFIFMLVGVGWGLYLLGKKERSSHFKTYTSLTLCTLFGLLLFPITPFSGLNELERPQFSTRFLFPPLVFGIPLFCVFLNRVNKDLLLIATLIITLLPFILSLDTTSIIIWTLAFIFCFLFLSFTNIRIPSYRLKWRSMGAIIFLLWSLLWLFHFPKAYLTNQALEKDAYFKPMILAASKIPKNSTVTYFNGWSGSYVLRYSYPFFGREYDLKYIPTNENGELLLPLHKRPQDKKLNENLWSYLRRMDEERVGENTLLDNFKRAHVDFVVITKSDPWAWQERALKKAHVKELDRVEDTVIYDLRK